MHQTPLDDTSDLGQSRRSHMLTWWMVGLGMGIALLAINLLDQAGYIPAIGRIHQDWITGLLFGAVLIAGPVLLANLLERAEPGISPRRSGLYACGSGALASVIFLFLKMVTSPMNSDFDLLSSAAILLMAGWFCGIAGSGFTTFVRERGWMLWLLALAAWIGVCILLLGMPRLRV